ncbi:MBL fold metallo-hydrolase [Halomonas maura]|uniref:MBL fold metallo-hydrolase n=1 Tax=Halomonas maura TaxID=117606 RepID=UPI00338EE398
MATPSSLGSTQGASITDMEAIFITHMHGDHVFGLERFACECRFEDNTSPEPTVQDAISMTRGT